MHGASFCPTSLATAVDDQLVDTSLVNNLGERLSEGILVVAHDEYIY